MARAAIDYATRRAAPAIAAGRGFDPDAPISGFYRHRLRSGGVAVAIRIWFGPPCEPWTGEEMDRAPRWNASVNGAWIDVEEVWPACADAPIDEQEADYLTRLQSWGAEHGHVAIADPRRRLNPLQTPLPF